MFWILVVIHPHFVGAYADTTFDVILESQGADLSQKNNKYQKVLISLIYKQCQYVYQLLILYKKLISFWIHLINATFDYKWNIFILPFSEHLIIHLVQLYSLFYKFLQYLDSSFQYYNYLSNRPYLSSYLHLLAYFLILLGGLAPAIDVNLIKIFQFKF
ncbi:unnamed protein product [Paramecium sonneborni]|uniref:Transmembrane protein n=1 Tax=Paramecium sonneborni TaxID=65129 RepID=A0A8S1R7N7_9CILI|nr:unnamed protein product [Paramecium sonneborni]